VLSKFSWTERFGEGIGSEFISWNVDKADVTFQLLVADSKEFRREVAGA